MSNPADTAAPRNHPALLNPSTVRDQTSHWKHPLQLFFTGKGKNLVWCVRSLYRSLFLPLQKFTAVYLFSEMTSPTKIMHSAAGVVCGKGLCVVIWPVKMCLCAWHVFNVTCLQTGLNISKIHAGTLSSPILQRS